MCESVSFGAITLCGDRPLLVAEAGVNHEHKLETALRIGKNRVVVAVLVVLHESEKV